MVKGILLIMLTIVPNRKTTTKMNPFIEFTGV